MKTHLLRDVTTNILILARPSSILATIFSMIIEYFHHNDDDGGDYISTMINIYK